MVTYSRLNLASGVTKQMFSAPYFIRRWYFGTVMESFGCGRAGGVEIVSQGVPMPGLSLSPPQQKLVYVCFFVLVIKYTSQNV